MPPKAKPSVKIDQDGDGDIDVSVDVETPDVPPGDGWPTGARQALTDLVGRMEPVVGPPLTRITYASARETLRDLLADNP